MFEYRWNAAQHEFTPFYNSKQEQYKEQHTTQITGNHRKPKSQKNVHSNLKRKLHVTFQRASTGRTAISSTEVADAKEPGITGGGDC